MEVEFGHVFSPPFIFVSDVPLLNGCVLRHGFSGELLPQVAGESPSLCSRVFLARRVSSVWPTKVQLRTLAYFETDAGDSGLL
jgi:hypothetical protein